MTNEQNKRWTTRTLLEWMATCFKEHSIESPRLISEMLLTHVLGGARIDLYANANRKATEEERETLRSLVKRTLEHEPVQYIVGKTWFNGLEFNVNSSTLIPRTCTETIVDQCVQRFKCNPHQTNIADIGTGTGCIAISIAKHLPHSSVLATDISEDALALGRENAHLHSVSKQISFKQGDGLQPLDGLGIFDAICSNPPYIPDHEFEKLDLNVKDWEPKIALSGGKNGLSIITPLIQKAPDHLKPGGMLLLEIAASTQKIVLDVANQTYGLGQETILRDRFGDDRFLRAIKD